MEIYLTRCLATLTVFHIHQFLYYQFDIRSLFNQWKTGVMKLRDSRTANMP